MAVVIHGLRMIWRSRFFRRADYRLCGRAPMWGYLRWNGFWAYRILWVGPFGFGFPEPPWANQVNDDFPRVAARLPEPRE